MSNTAAPPVASITPSPSLSFSLNNTSVGVDASTINQVMTESLLIQPDGSLSMYANLKLSVEGQINSQTEFVNVIVYSRINGVPVQFESRKTDDELTYLLNMSPSDPKNEEVYRNLSNNKVTHIRFRFDRILLPLPSTPNDPNPGLPNEVIGMNAYEQNNGSTTLAEKGKNYSIAYQSSALQGVSFTVGANPGKPTIEFVGQPSIATVSTNLSVTAALRITFPTRTGGVKLRTYNVYMSVDSQTNHQVVAQLLNQPSGSVIPDDVTYVDITPNQLYYNGLVDGDIVSFSASVDNVNFKESPLSNLVSVVATLRASTPVITSYRSAEILLPSVTTGYSSTADIPGVRFSFKAERAGNAGNWKFVSLWARLAGSGDPYRMAQQWSRGTQINGFSDIDNQLQSTGICEKVWNQKTVGTLATWVSATNGTDSTGGAPLPAYTAFDMYLVLSENANIANIGASIANAADTVGQKTGIPLQSQSNPSVVIRVITSIYRPSVQIINTNSNIDTSIPTNLTLSNLYTGSELNMPATHVAPYYTNGSQVNLQLYLTLKALDIANSDSVVYDGALTPTVFNSKLVSNTANVIPSPSSFVNLSSLTQPAQWKPSYAFSLTNSLVVLVTSVISQTLANTPTEYNYTQPSQIVKIGDQTFLIYYTYSSLDLVRTRPIVGETVLPNVFVKSVGESRTYVSGSGTTSAFGATQLLVALNSAVAYNKGPYKWNQLVIQVSSTSSFDADTTKTAQTTLSSANALLAELLYLPNTLTGVSQGYNFGDLVIAPMSGAGIANVGFPSWVPASAVYVRLRLRYTWNGSNASGSLADQYYDGPFYGASLSNASVLYTLKDVPPLPPLQTLTVTRTRALKLNITSTIPEPSLQLVANNPQTQMNLVSITFNLVDAFNNPVVFPAGFSSSVVVPYTNATVGSPATGFFSFPSTFSSLDKFYSVIGTAQYKDINGSVISSPPLRSNEIFFERIANITHMIVSENQFTIKCIAQIDLGDSDNVPVNTSTGNTNASISVPLTNNLYVPGGMLLTCIVPAQEGSTEKFAHHMTWNSSLVFPNGGVGGYETVVLTKIQNTDLYGLKSTFLVIVNNSTGLAVGMFPKQASAGNADSYNIISTFN